MIHVQLATADDFGSHFANCVRALHLSLTLGVLRPGPSLAWSTAAERYYCHPGRSLLVPAIRFSQQKALAYVATRSHGGALDPTLRVTVNFHPARAHRGVPLLRPLADDGEYRSQFVTGTVNGSLSAFPGAERSQ